MTKFLLEDFRGYWAIITGATSGIGREFALNFAARGLNVVLIARHRQDLDKVAQQCLQYKDVQTYTIAMDLSMRDAAQKIKSELSSHNIKPRLLCNNAAMGYWGDFQSPAPNFYEQMIGLNILAGVSLTALLLEDLISFPTSAIINVSSQAAYQPVPYMAVYGATKAFMQSFGQALHGELAQCGILVQTLIPGPTVSRFDETFGAPPAISSKRDHPSKAVKASLMNLETGIPVVTSVKGTYKQRCFAGLAPHRFVIKSIERMFRPPR